MLIARQHAHFHFLITPCALDRKLVKLGLQVPVKLLVLCAIAVFGTVPVTRLLLLMLLNAPLTIWCIALVAFLAFVDEAEAIGAINFNVLAIIFGHKKRLLE